MQAFTGLISITGEPDRPGVRVGTSLIDLGTGVWAALGILAALHERAQTGRGREVDVALFETGLSLVGYQLTDAFRTGRAGAHGTAFPLIAPYEVFPTADGELMIAAANDRLFAQLCAAIGLPELAYDPRFRTNPDRLAHRTSCCRSIRERTRAAKLRQVAHRARGHPRLAGPERRRSRTARADAGKRAWCRSSTARDARAAAPDRRRARRARGRRADARRAIGRGARRARLLRQRIESLAAARVTRLA